MPTYDFKCRKCKKPFTVVTSISALSRAKCPKCGKKEIDRIWEPFVAVTKKKT